MTGKRLAPRLESLDGKVVFGKDVFAAQAEHEDDLRCPVTYSFDGGKLFEDVLVWHL